MTKHDEDPEVNAALELLQEELDALVEDCVRKAIKHTEALDDEAD